MQLQESGGFEGRAAFAMPRHQHLTRTQTRGAAHCGRAVDLVRSQRRSGYGGARPNQERSVFVTTKDAFAPEEWTLVREAPTSAGMIVLTASHGGTFRETVA